MKRHILMAVALGNFAAVAPAQTFISPPRVVDIEPHRRVLEFTNRIQMPDGRLVERVGGYTEIGTGMFYPSDEEGTWQESQELIELVNGVGIARRGAVRVIFAANANSEAATEIFFAGQRFRNHVLGLSFSSHPPGQPEQVVSLATVKDAVGELVAPNQILYRDAFDGVQADILYTVTRAGLEQEVIVGRALAWTPEDFGFARASTRLEVTTVFVEAPVPEKAVRRRGALQDETLVFGPLRMGPGKAFTLHDATGWSVPVSKTWLGVDNWGYLVEAVEYAAIADQLAALPAADPQAAVKKPRAVTVAQAEDRIGLMPKLAPSQLTGATVQVAQQQRNARGLSIDYTLVISTQSWVFRGNETYLVAGPVFLTNVVIEGNAVVKFTNGAYLDLEGSVTCQTGPYRVATLTAVSDHTIGEQLCTNALAGYSAASVLRLHEGSHQLGYLRLAHAAEGIRVEDGDLTLWHSQFTQCEKGLVLTGADAAVRNVLFDNVQTPFWGSNLCVRAEHVTVHACQNLAAGGSTNTSTVALTNAVLVQMTNWGPATFQTNAVGLSSDSAVFVQVGAGAHYLAPGSAWRNAGTTNVNAQLAAELKRKTSYAPVVLTNQIERDTTLWLQAQRDVDLPDLGYLYDPIDYAVSTLVVTNATLTLAPGAALATFGTGGLWLQDYGQLRSEGSPLQLNQLARYSAVQERTTNWGNGCVWGDVIITPFHSGHSPPVARLVFTQSSIPADSGYHTYADSSASWGFTVLELKHCQFYGGSFYLDQASGSSYGLTNNLLSRTRFQTLGYQSLRVQNQLFREDLGTEIDGYLFPFTNTWIFQDNLLESSSLHNYTADLAHDYNGFYISTNFYSDGQATNANEKIVANLTYQAGPLGLYYYPTNSPLVDAGSCTNAALAGLYHFTALTNQTKEATNRLDIGFHWVALTNGVPVDSDGDGIPDYLEDRNGNGSVDAGETDWKQTYNSLLGIGSSGPGLIVFTPLE